MADTRIPGVREGVRPAGGNQRLQGEGAGIRPAFVVPNTAGPNGCAGRTKTGDWCSAYPVSGSNLCVGHSRSVNGDPS